MRSTATVVPGHGRRRPPTRLLLQSMGDDGRNDHGPAWPDVHGGAGGGIRSPRWCGRVREVQAKAYASRPDGSRAGAEVAPQANEPWVPGGGVSVGIAPSPAWAARNVARARARVACCSAVSGVNSTPLS